MLWHLVSLDLAHLDDTSRRTLEADIERLRDVPEVRWFHLGRDVERPHVTAFMSVFDDHSALERYRLNATHLEVADSIRSAQARSFRIDLDGLGMP